MRLALVCLATLVTSTGCGFGDCGANNPSQSVDQATRLVVDGAEVGETLTVAVVDPYGLTTGTTLGTYGSRPEQTVAEDGAIALSLQLDGLEYADASAQTLAAVPRGDTVYVYLSGTLDPDLIREACSPTEGPSYVVDVAAVAVPPRVQEVRVVSVRLRDVAPEAAAALRQRDAERPRPATIV